MEQEGASSSSRRNLNNNPNNETGESSNIANASAVVIPNTVQAIVQSVFSYVLQDLKVQRVSASSSKKRKSNGDFNETAVASTSTNASAGGAPNIVQTAAILKLDIDCFEETFDFLSLVDLLSVGQTCKRLQQVSGYIFNQNYGGLKICNNSGKFCLERVNRYQVIPICFEPYLRKLLLTNNLSFHHLHRVQVKWKQIRQLEIFHINLTGDTLEHFQRILPKLEHLRINRCTVDGDFNSSILAFCPKIKRLSLSFRTALASMNRGIIGNGNDWLRRKYPTLEHLEINASFEFPEIGTFLELNPNIRKFSMAYTFMSEYANYLMASNAKLDELVLVIGFRSSLRNAFGILQKLHRCGFYKRLKLFISQMNRVISITRLVQLNVVRFKAEFLKTVRLSRLSNLEELYIYDTAKIIDFPELSTNLQHLKQIGFYSESIDAIMPFVSRARNLKIIKIDTITDGAYFSTETKVVKLRALNKEREKLCDAQRITIYVAEEIYLATKWAIKETDFDFIRLRRSASVDWTLDYEICR